MSGNSKWFREKSRVEPECVVDPSGSVLRVAKREVYAESPNEPGCYKKRVFWEAQLSPNLSPYGLLSTERYWSVTGEGATRAEAIVAAVEAMLDKSEA